MASADRILLLGPANSLRSELAGQLAKLSEFEVIEASNTQQAAQKIASGAPMLTLIDEAIGANELIEAIRLMRQKDANRPILLIGQDEALADTLAEQFIAIQEFFTRPMRFGLLLAQLRQHLKSARASEQATLHLGPFTFRPGAKALYDKNGEELRLTEKESAILAYLYHAGDKMIGKDELLRKIWGYNDQVTTHTLETHIYRMRQKLIDADSTADNLLLTEAGGYRLHLS